MYLGNGVVGTALVTQEFIRYAKNCLSNNYYAKLKQRNYLGVQEIDQTLPRSL